MPDYGEVLTLARRGLRPKGSLPGWSFGFLIPEGGKRRRNGITEISEIELLEVGPTLVGANHEARTLAVKALEQADDEGSLETMSLDELRTYSEELIAKSLPRNRAPVEVVTFKC